MKLKSLLSLCLVFILISCSENEIKINNTAQLNLIGEWKVTKLNFLETLESSIKGVTSIEKLENIGSNFTLTYTFESNPNELTSTGVFDLEITNAWGKKDFSNGVKGIDGVYPPSNWVLKDNTITLTTDDYTQEIQITDFTETTLELQYTYVRSTINTLNSDSTTKTTIFNLTLERI